MPDRATLEQRNWQRPDGPADTGIWLAADAEAVADAAGDAWTRAAARANTLETAQFGLPGLQLSVRAAGAGLLPLFTGALTHHPGRSPDCDDTAYDWRLVDAALVGDALRIPGPTLPLGRYGYMQHNADGSILIERRAGFTTVLEVKEKRFTTIVEDAAAVDNDVIAKPLLRFLIGILFQVGDTALHAALVGQKTGGLLVTGLGGAGKSTIAAAALAGSLEFVADDFLVVSKRDDDMIGRSLFASALLGDGSLALLPELTALCRRPRGAAPWQKHLLPVAEAFPRLACREMPIRAIVVPRRVEGAEPALSPMPRSRALLALAPTSIFSSPWREAERADPIFALAEHVPAVQLTVGRNLAGLPDLIRRYLGDLQVED